MENRSKAKQIFLYVAPFPALAFFKIWASGEPSAQTLLWVAAAMLTYGVIILIIASRWDRPSYFDWAVTAYFALITAALSIWPESARHLIPRYAVTGIYACLFSASFFPPLFGLDPFTYHYAKKSTPRVFWGNPIFIRINRIMTYVWSAVFALCVLLSLYPSLFTRALIPIAVILGFGLPFNLLFPDIYLRRLGLPSLADQKRMTAPAASHPPVQQPERKEIMRSIPTEDRQRPQTINFNQGKENPMKILVLNSSSRTGRESKTELMLNHLVSGMREAGASVEVVELRKKKIAYCIGCFTCWTKTPGKCIHNDDMAQELFPKWLEADVVVYGTPLYHYTVNALLKTFIERTLPVLEPFFLQDGGRTRHPLRQKLPKTVILSVAGFPDRSVFDQLSSWIRFVFGGDGNLVAEIYRPGAEMLTGPVLREKAQRILAATEQAGREIVNSMQVSPETLAQITEDMASDWETFSKIGNLMWKTCIREGITPREFGEKGFIPRPDSIETFLLIMPLGFRPDVAQGLKAVLQFNFTGEAEGACHFRIDHGKIEAFQGPAEKPDLTIETPFEMWMDIMTKKADGQQAFMEQKYRVQGDFALLLKMKELFRG